MVTAEQEESGEWEYLIHYQGWNKKWDEWLPGDRLIKDTAAARQAEVWTCVSSPPHACHSPSRVPNHPPPPHPATRHYAASANSWPVPRYLPTETEETTRGDCLSATPVREASGRTPSVGATPPGGVEGSKPHGTGGRRDVGGGGRHTRTHRGLGVSD